MVLTARTGPSARMLAGSKAPKNFHFVGEFVMVKIVLDTPGSGWKLTLSASVGPATILADYMFGPLSDFLRAAGIQTCRLAAGLFCQITGGGPLSRLTLKPGFAFGFAAAIPATKPRVHDHPLERMSHPYALHSHPLLDGDLLGNPTPRRLLASAAAHPDRAVRRVQRRSRDLAHPRRVRRTPHHRNDGNDQVPGRSRRYYTPVPECSGLYAT